MIDWRDRITIIGAVTVSVIVVLAFSAICAAMFFREIPAGSKDLANILFGGLIAAFTGVVQYWTGSNSSAQKKDATIAQTAAVAAGTAATVATVAAAQQAAPSAAAKGSRR